MIKSLSKKVMCPNCYSGTLIEIGTDFYEKDTFCTVSECNKCANQVDIIWHRESEEIKQLLEFGI